MGIIQKFNKKISKKNVEMVKIHYPYPVSKDGQ